MMKENNASQWFHVLCIKPEFSHQILTLDEIHKLKRVNHVTQLAIFRVTDFTSFAESATAASLVYGLVWKDSSHSQLKAGDFLEDISAIHKDLEGHYIIVRWDKASSKLTVQTDFLGTRSLYYYHQQSYFILAQESSIIRAFLPHSPSVNNTAFAASIAGVKPIPSTTTPTLIEHVNRVCGNTTLELIGNTLTGHVTHHHIRNRIDEQIEENKDVTKERLLTELKDTLLSELKRLSRSGLSSALDLSGGLDSGVLLGSLLSLNTSTAVTNSLVCEGALDVERENLERWRQEFSNSINMIEMQPLAERLISDYKKQAYLDVQGAGITHIQELVDAAANANAKLRIIGFGPDEFMTHPLHHSIWHRLVAATSFQQRYKFILTEAYRTICLSNCPDFFISIFTKKTVPGWFSDTARNAILKLKIENYRYQKEIDYLDAAGNRQFKIEFYQAKTQQLQRNDELSLKQNIFCYYPYLNKRFIAISHCLAARHQLSTNNDAKHEFRQLMKDLLPEYLRSHTANNENFEQYNLLLQTDFIDKAEHHQNMRLFEDKIIDKSTFERHRKAGKIHTSVLARVMEHEAFLQSI